MSEPLDLRGHLGSVADDHGHGTTTDSERDTIPAFAGGFLLGRGHAGEHLG